MAVKEGKLTFPNTVNDVLSLVETLAEQNIVNVKSANNLDNAAFHYEVNDGKVIEEAIIEMAKGQAFDKNAFDKTPVDPTLHVKYFDEYTEQQFPVTVRMNDIRKVIANKGTGAEDLAERILDTITQAEAAYDFTKIRETVLGAAFKDYSTILGGKPTNMKGVIFALRDMFNHLKSNNSDLTDEAYVSATPASDIRVVVPVKLLNLMDVTELANIFHLTKEELFGMIIPMEDSDLVDKPSKYTVYVYDKKAIGRATRLYEYSQDISGKGLFTNHYLTVARAYFHNGLFKGAKLDCTVAAEKELGTLVSPGK